MTKKGIATIVLAAAVLAACQTGGPKQTGGTLVGAGLGALAGSQIGGGSGRLAAVAIGTLAGAYLGSEVGQSLDRADQAAMNQNAQSSLEYGKTGQTSTWQNPDSGHSGTFTPTGTFQNTSGQYCREYQSTVTIDGQQEVAHGRACRQPDGSWKIVE